MNTSIIKVENVLSKDQTLLVNQEEILVANLELPHAIVSEVILNNGKRTQIITLFNQHDLNNEEMEVGVHETLKHHRNAVAFRTKFCSGVKNGRVTSIWSSEWRNVTHVNYDYVSN